MGSQHLSYLQLGKETTKGTRVAATRRLAPSLESAWNPDFMLNLHENRSTGRHNPVSYATSMGTQTAIHFQTGPDGVAFDQIQTFSQFPGGDAATGAGPYQWDHSYGGTADGSFFTYTAELGDDVQEYEAGNVFCTNWSLSAEVGGMTQLSADLLAWAAAKSTKTNLTVASPIKIPSYLWQWKHASSQSGIAGASYQTGQLKSFELAVTTGLTAGKYLDGSANFTAPIETVPMGGTLHLVLVHNSDAVSEIYDNAAAGTPTFFYLNALGPTLGGGNYQCSITGCWIPNNPVPISAFIDGQSCVEVTGQLAYDVTWTKSLLVSTTNNLNTYV